MSLAQTDELVRQLTAIRADMVGDADASRRRVSGVHANFRASALNLLHYLALRRHDLRALQTGLAALGLSSLGRAESHVLSSVDAVLDALHRMTDRTWQPPAGDEAPLDFARGEQLLAEHTDTLLGPATPGRQVRIMVTMPSEAGRDYTLVHDLLQQGMNGMRINCAHDGPPVWLRMIEHLRRAEQALGRPCRVVMDLGGPKLRTGPLEPGPAVVRIRPERDVFGHVVAPARIWLTACDAAPPSPADAVLPMPADWLSNLKAGDEIDLADARDARRSFTVADVTAAGCWAESRKTAYIVPGTLLRHRGAAAPRGSRKAAVGPLPPREDAVLLHEGDPLVITRALTPGRASTRDSSGRILTPATISCTLPEVLDHVRPGEPIWFDDGKVGGVIENVEAGQVVVRIRQAREGGVKLRADKGINLPESRLQLPALTGKDREDLAFVARHADIVELSFAGSSGDIEQLQEELARIGSRPPAIVLKVETRRGFEHLPEMLLAAMRGPCCGVMIARGDLAVECGFERLAEVQEEILWICEAAHVPVIWATQVLETLAQSGIASRAEITDAAMGHRAECVMLNKGPHILGAVRALDDILRRMQAHQAKKRAMLRELRLAHALPEA